MAKTANQGYFLGWDVFEFDFMTWHYQIVYLIAKTRRRSGHYVLLVVLCDAFLARGFLVADFFAAVFFKAVFFNTIFCFSGLASLAGCIDDFDFAAPFGGVVVSNSQSDSETA